MKWILWYHRNQKPSSMLEYLTNDNFMKLGLKIYVCRYCICYVILFYFRFCQFGIWKLFCSWIFHHFPGTVFAAAVPTTTTTGTSAIDGT